MGNFLGAKHIMPSLTFAVEARSLPPVFSLISCFTSTSNIRLGYKCLQVQDTGTIFTTLQFSF